MSHGKRHTKIIQHNQVDRNFLQIVEEVVLHSDYSLTWKLDFSNEEKWGTLGAISRLYHVDKLAKWTLTRMVHIE